MECSTDVNIGGAVKLLKELGPEGFSDLAVNLTRSARRSSFNSMIIPSHCHNHKALRRAMVLCLKTIDLRLANSGVLRFDALIL
ncbi:hypothetical protein MPTK1_8g08030 [Marchantia polymorpha subsp. ruderalis]|uniref:Uncharacterized protein n=1 Tax=Marchantia polymorpha TaxID=3197 RepID=A0A2R6W4N4_MARPO|nr:hypothetical protein MARPO_0155s0014 [Marchantia polymorpha]BBN19118.1 hypothetical protein Mp_8g08030 [Marchantia polymorpha subsp. ruderalis]|eukprot:PTQ28752.1 hypothetical protein MARPO_0155s0014 [Marchantia polymorpha]